VQGNIDQAKKLELSEQNGQKANFKAIFFNFKCSTSRQSWNKQAINDIEPTDS
jgi:hypothetical protein